MADDGRRSGIGIAVRYDGETEITWLPSSTVCALLAAALRLGVAVEQVAVDWLAARK